MLQKYEWVKNKTQFFEFIATMVLNDEGASTAEIKEEAAQLEQVAKRLYKLTARASVPPASCDTRRAANVR